MKRTFVTTLLAVMVFLAIPGTAALAIDLPDNMQIISAKVYHSLVETDDMLVVFHAKVNYDSANGTYPTVPASSSILMRFVSDNGTILASSTPYVYSPFDTNGYGDLVSSFYLGADDAPAWEGEHVLNITGLPIYYSPLPTPVNYTLQISDYDDSEDQDTNQSDLYIEVLRLTDVFKIIYPDVALKSITDVGTVLSAYGEAYFKSAIPGLLDLCPALFYVQVYTPEVIEVEPYDTSLGDTLAERMGGTDIQRGMDRLGDIVGVGGSFIAGIVTFIGTMALCIFSMRRGWGIEPGIALSTLAVTLMAVLFGDFLFNLLMILALIAAIGIMYIVALRRA